MGKKQSIQLCTIFIRLILVIYYVFDTPKNIQPVFAMIIVTTIIYTVLAPRRLIYEIVNTGVQCIVIYFKNVINDYRIEISSDNFIFQIEILLMILVIIYSIYFFLRNIEDIIDQANRKKVKKNEKR